MSREVNCKSGKRVGSSLSFLEGVRSWSEEEEEEGVVVTHRNGANPSVRTRVFSEAI